MVRPQRTIRRESSVKIRSGGVMRQLVLHVPPTCDVLMIREKGRHKTLELDIITAYYTAARLAGRQQRTRKG